MELTILGVRLRLERLPTKAEQRIGSLGSAAVNVTKLMPREMGVIETLESWQRAKLCSCPMFEGRQGRSFACRIHGAEERMRWVENLPPSSGRQETVCTCPPMYRPTLKDRLKLAVQQAEEKLVATKRAKEILDNNPDLEELLDIMQRSHF